MTQIRVPQSFISALLLLSISLLFILAQPVKADIEPRISNAFTAWDDYFFYAAFQVNDHNVLSTNRTPVSHPQEDDDIEVFFDTKPSDASTVRSIHTYQMAVSAGSGAYFSQGNGTKIPTPMEVLTYKYAVTIDGSLNDPNDNDNGYTVEIAIPWEELGLSGPPAPGQVWGFNVISRNKDSIDIPSTSFASLSNLVHSNSDVQDPSKWSKIEFIATLSNQLSGAEHVFCPRVASNANYPVIDGVIRDGEWNTEYGFSFGQQMIRASAPRSDNEPNIKNSPFADSLQPVVRTPTTGVVTTRTPNSDTPDYDITLPGGGEVHVGKIENPPPPQAFVPEEPVQRGHGVVHYQPGSDANPLAPNLPADLDVTSPIGPSIDPNASLALTPQSTVGPLVLATYSFATSSSIVPSACLDQPMDGFGPAFGGNRTQWHISQLADARRAGIDVLLVTFDPADPNGISGLASLVEALKEMQTKGQDIPLLGLYLKGVDPSAALKSFLTIVPEEFRAEVVLPDTDFNQPAYIVYADTLPDITSLKSIAAAFTDRSTLLVTTSKGIDYLQIATVSPGGRDDYDNVVGRNQTHTYALAWQKVYSSNPNWVVINSWNDYRHGTEVAASRQYAEQYADLTRIAGLQWAGAQQWDAKYLQSNVPSVMAPKTIYTVSIRVENNGSLPWRAGENYALCYRWYKDGRLYDDSAPRLPLTNDIYPGESTTVKIGVVAQNSFGSDIEPGLYTLVFDMVQGQDRWFTYVGSEPLRVPVRVVDSADALTAKVTVLGSTTPAIIDRSGTYQVSLQARNDGQEVWNATNTTVTVVGNGIDATGTFSSTVNPGAIGTATLRVEAPQYLAAGQVGTLTWQIKTPGVNQTWVEHPYIAAKDLGASFGLNDIDREVETGKTGTAKVGILNIGPSAWAKCSWKIGYRWYYLDGTPATGTEGTAAIPVDVAPGGAAEVDFSYRAPLYPGRYQLVMDVEDPDGTTTIDATPTRGKAVLPLLVNVTAGKNAFAVPVDLTKLFDTNGIGYETSPELGDFDGNQKSLPGVFIPPDGTQEVDTNPLLAGKPGLPQYPSGYYSSFVGDGPTSNHRISFLYGPKGANNVITCKGQLITLPAGKWKTIHILAASVGTAASVTEEFGIGYSGLVEVANLTIANWTKIPDPTTATVGLRLPYSLNKGDVIPNNPVFLGDYAIATDSTKTLQHLSLPKDPMIKILAVTLER